MPSLELTLNKAILAFLLLASSLAAQTVRIPGPGGKISVAAYSGAGDVVASAVAFWSMDAYNAATKGTKAVQICNVADVVCADLSTDATTGALVVTTIGGSNCAIVTCTIKIWYDQSGAMQCSAGTVCDLTNSTIANRPTFIVSCINSKPCARFAAASSQVLNAVSGTNNVNQPFTVSYISQQTAGFTTNGDVLWAGGGTMQVGYGANVNTAFMYLASSAPEVTAANSTFHAVQNVANDTSSDIYVDGSTNTVSPGTSIINGTYQIGGNNFITGDIFEVGVWASAFSSGNKSAMNTNQHSRGGF